MIGQRMTRRPWYRRLRWWRVRAWLRRAWWWLTITGGELDD